MIFKGSGVALATPFTEKGINFDVFEKLIEFQIANDTDALVVCGTTGEPSTMNSDEKRAAVAFVVKTADGRIPVIAGIGGNNTADVINCACHAQDSGASALLAVTPYYNKCNRAGMIAHFTAIADATNLPVIIYNVPSRTGINMSPDVFAELCSHPNIAAVKEASADICQIAEMSRLARGNAVIYSGNDDHIVPVLSLGGVGVISVLANILPKYTHNMVTAFLEGRTSDACDMQLAVNPLVHALFSEVNPIPVKTALRLMGFDMGALRLPLSEMDCSNAQLLAARMREFGLID